MPIFEDLPVPGMGLAIGKCHPCDALVGVGMLVAKRLIGATPLMGGEHMRKCMGNLRQFTILFVPLV